MVIITEKFPELEKHYDITLGVYDEFPSLQDTWAHFAGVMRKYGYRKVANHTWLKPGFAAVIEPR